MTEAKTTKREIRATLRKMLAELDVVRLAAGSVVAARHLIETEEFRRAHALMIFLPLRYEVDARSVALRAWQEGKTVAVPLIERTKRSMMPVVVRGFDEPMDVDEYGIQIPRAVEPLPLEMIDLIIAPGLGFDRRGGRIGRGGGFYDRFLAQPAVSATVCGLALDEQVLDTLPHEPHDVSVEMLVTDRQVLRFQAAGMMHG